MESKQSIIQDRAIASEDADLLDRSSFVENLIRALVTENTNSSGGQLSHTATGCVVGLTGKWGSGKSSVLNLVAKKLSASDDVVVAVYNPWFYSGRSELFSGFFNSLRGAMGKGRVENVRELVEAVDRYWGTIDAAAHGAAALVDFHGGAGTASTLWRKFGSLLRGALPKLKSRTPDEERLALEKKIQAAGLAIIVLIDELDRVEDEEVRAVAQLVKAVGDIKGVSYLVAYDADRVVQALGRGDGEERRRSGEAYLEKIIQYTVPLRPLFKEDSDVLFHRLIDESGIHWVWPERDAHQQLVSQVMDEVRTPREFKRLVGTFSVLARMMDGEINNYDLLAYCSLINKSPTLWDAIATHVDELVTDPSTDEMASRAARKVDGKGELDLIDVLGEGASSSKATLKLMFPRFSDTKAEDDGDRLFRRQNLIRLLYLGNPPNMVSRGEVEALWRTENTLALISALQSLLDQGKLRALVDRLDALVAALPIFGHNTFWYALSQALIRRSPWIKGPESQSAIKNDAALILYRLGNANHSKRELFKNIIHGLQTRGDLLFSPWILRQHLFAYGLTVPPMRSRGGGLLSKDETEEILTQELPRYRRAVLDGSVLTMLPTADVMFAILNCGSWDEELRISLTAQLDGLHPISTFAALIVAPGLSIDRAALDQLVDVDVLGERIKMVGHRPENPWLLESWRRLELVVEGKDPNWEV